MADYSALGPNSGSVSWRLSGTDGSDFSINSRGALSFRSTPNYESPADSDRDNLYEFTVTARSGRDQDSLDVVVDVYNVDEGGEVRLSPNRGDIGTRHHRHADGPGRRSHQRRLGVGEVGNRDNGLDAHPRDELGQTTSWTPRTRVTTCRRRPTTRTPRAAARAPAPGPRQSSVRTMTGG